MKNIISLFIAVISLGLSIQINAQEKADAVYENIVHEFIINEDSSSIYNYSHKLKYFTYQSFQRQHGESFIVYNPNYQKLKIRKSETTMADGITKVESPVNAYNEVLPRFAAHAAPYMHYKEMVVTHVGLEKNCIVDFSYSLENKKDFMPGIQGRVFLRNERPIKEMEIRVVVPKGRKINHFLLNAKQEPEVQETARWTVYKWVFENIPMIEEEHNHPYLGEFAPTLFVSTANQDEVADYFKNYTKLIEPSDAIKTKVQELIKGKEDNLDKIAALQDYVLNNVGGTYVSPELVAYKNYCATSIFKNNVGTQLDKAILLTSMAKAAGIEANVIFATTYNEYKKDAALLEQFRNALVQFPNEGLFVDPTAKNHQFAPNSLKGKAYFTLANPTEMFEIEKLEDNLIKVDAEFSISSDYKTSGSASYEANGYFKHELSEDCFKKELKSFLSSASFKVGDEINIENFTKEKANQASLKYTENALTEKYEGLYCFEVPGANFIIDKFHLSLGSNKRQTPLKVEVPFEEEYQYSVQIPENAKVIIPTENTVSIKNSIGELVCSITQKGNKIIVERMLKISEIIIEAESYKEYTELISTWKQDKFKKVYFKKK